MERPVPPSPPSAAAGASRPRQQPTAPRLQHVSSVQLHTDTVAAEPAVEGSQLQHAADEGGRQLLAAGLGAGAGRQGPAAARISVGERDLGKHLSPCGLQSHLGK